MHSVYGSTPSPTATRERVAGHPCDELCIGAHSGGTDRRADWHVRFLTVMGTTVGQTFYGYTRAVLAYRLAEMGIIPERTVSVREIHDCNEPCLAATSDPAECTCRCGGARHGSQRATHGPVTAAVAARRGRDLDRLFARTAGADEAW